MRPILASAVRSSASRTRVALMLGLLALPVPLALGQNASVTKDERASAEADLASARGLSRTFQRVFRSVEPAVVYISALRSAPEMVRDGFFMRRTGRVVDRAVGFGSGVIVDPTGVLLTNNHVVEPAERLRVKLADGREFDGSVVGRDPLTDLAIVRLENVPSGEALPTATIGDSDSVGVGDWVVAIGSPFGFANTVTTGIVSAKGRSGINLPGASSDMYQDFIQTDAAINPGNSGGPLLDLEGRIVGINSAIATRAGGSEGIGFAIPTHIIRGVMDSILKNGRVVRGFIGVDLEDVTPARLRQLGVSQDMLRPAGGAQGGVKIIEVGPNSPAAAAGLQVGDIVLRFNGRPVNQVSALRAAIAVTAPGTRATLDLLRDAKPATVEVEIADQSRAVARADGAVYVEKFGGSVRTVDDAMRRRLGPGFGRVRGVMVREIDEFGPAATSEFESGDIIVAVDGGAVTSVEEFEEALRAADLREGVRLDIIRGRFRGNIELRAE